MEVKEVKAVEKEEEVNVVERVVVVKVGVVEEMVVASVVVVKVLVVVAVSLPTILEVHYTDLTMSDTTKTP